MYLFIRHCKKDEILTTINIINDYANWLAINVKVTVFTFKMDSSKSIVLCHLGKNIKDDIRLIYEELHLNSYLQIDSFNSLCFQINDSNKECKKQIFRGTKVKLEYNKISIFTPIATPEQFYYLGNISNYIFSNDLRLMEKFSKSELSDEGIYSYFQYMTATPTFTFFKDINRIPLAHQLDTDNDGNFIIQPNYFPKKMEIDVEVDSDNFHSKIEHVMGSILGEVENPVLLFSGGVDSLFILSQLRRLSKDNITLFNYSFGENDQEARLAFNLSKSKKIQFEQVTYEDNHITQLFSNIGRDYSYPFADRSTIPTNALVHSTFKCYKNDNIILDGTGADGLFGIGQKYRSWSNLYQVPSIARFILGKIYELNKIYLRNDKLEYYLRLIKRSSQFNINNSAIMAQNALNGTLYSVPLKVRNNIEEEIEIYLMQLIENLDPKEQFSMVDIIHICSNLFSQKTFDPYRRAGISIVYPFLDAKMITLSNTIPWSIKMKDNVQKAQLKYILESYTDKENIYRKKSGFSPPFHQILQTEEMRSIFYDVVYEGEIIEYCNKEVIKKIFDLSRTHVKMNDSIYNFLWSLIFSSVWLKDTHGN